MKILMVNEKNHFFGGVEQLVNDVSHGLTERGHSVALLHTEECPESRDELNAPFVRTALADPCASIETWRRQVDLMVSRFSPDVVYVHRLGSIRALEGLLELAPVIRYVHDHDVYCPRRHKYFPFHSQICERPLGFGCAVHGCLISRNGPIPGLPGLINLSAKRKELELNRRIPKLCVGSQWMQRMMYTNGFGQKQVEIVPPIPRGLERATTPMGEEPIVLFLGQIVRGKGVDLLLRALTEVKQKFRALIIGTGNHLDTCVKLARELNLGGKVSFLGWVDHNKLPQYFERARVVVVPSRWPEPFGMVGLEAMWATRPVVGFSVGGVPDWLENGRTGIAVNEQDWSAMGQALDQILRDRSFARNLGHRGWERASNEFRFEDQIAETEKFLSKSVFHGTDQVEGKNGAPDDRS